VSALRLPVVQGSEDWLTARRSLITATDIPVLLGLSPYKCEADLADEKLLGTQTEQTIPMKVGLALEPVIRETYEEQTGRKLRRHHGLIVHRDVEWAACSPDYTVVREPLLVETKWSTSRSRFADGLPQDVEAQAVWQAAVGGVEAVDVAVLLTDELRVFTVPSDPVLFGDLVAVAADFRRRLADGGPFSRDARRVKRDHPSDDGSELVADAELDQAVRALIETRTARKALEETETAIETAVKDRMAEHAILSGSGWRVTWKRTKDRTETDWQSIATGLLRTLPETERETFVGLHTAVRPGFRPFRVVLDKED
jgi:putative phage-type endonuclease